MRKSEGKADAAQQIMKRFDLDAEQTDAILELKIYRLARLEILVIRQEADEKRKRARQIGGLLRNEDSRWALVRAELEQIAEAVRRRAPQRHCERRRRAEYTAEDFIVEEDNVVIVSRDGWVKRQKEVKDVASTRLREGDQVVAVLPGQHARAPWCSSATSAWPTARGLPTCPRPPGTANRSSGSSS